MGAWRPMASVPTFGLERISQVPAAARADPLAAAGSLVDGASRLTTSRPPMLAPRVPASLRSRLFRFAGIYEMHSASPLHRQVRSIREGNMPGPYQKLTPPTAGHAIRLASNGQLEVPDDPIIPFIEG